MGPRACPCAPGWPRPDQQKETSQHETSLSSTLPNQVWQYHKHVAKFDIGCLTGNVAPGWTVSRQTTGTARQPSVPIKTSKSATLFCDRPDPWVRCGCRS